MFALLSMEIFLQVGHVRAENPFALHEAARKGSSGEVKKRLIETSDINLKDHYGKTALHYAAENGHGATTTILLEGGIDASIKDQQGLTAYEYALRNGHDGTAAILKQYLGDIRIVCPNLKYRNKASFEEAIKGPACLLKSENVWLFAPKEFESSARIIFNYLTNAYDALYAMTGIDTEYIIVVYNFPKGHKEAIGGTSNCVLYYDDSNLRLNDSEEWKKHKVPHVCGYIEKMAHNFVHAAKVQFGWEAVGWSISVQATEIVAPNPIFLRSIQQARLEQLQTYRQYEKLKLKFPPDIPANKVDRIHAYLLWQCEKKYGPEFWKDFFVNVREKAKDFQESKKLKGDNTKRNHRYRISVDCFDALDKIEFKKMLSKAAISLTTDIKSLDPESPDWNRKLH